MVRRWQQLPLDHALARVPAVRLLLADLGESTSPATAATIPVPDLGPAVVMDQLTVLVYDACAAPGGAPADLAPRLADLRRSLA